LAFIIRTYAYILALIDLLIIDFKPGGKCLIFWPTYSVFPQKQSHMIKNISYFASIFYDTLH